MYNDTIFSESEFLEQLNPELIKASRARPGIIYELK